MTDATALRLLIVDDDFLFTNMLPRELRRGLARPTLEIAVARSPAEATRVLVERDFDAVVCDYDLRAAETGIDVLRRVAADHPAALRVLISGHARLPDFDDAAYDALVEKPMILRDVVPVLRALLAERLGVAFDLAA